MVLPGIRKAGGIKMIDCMTNRCRGSLAVAAVCIGTLGWSFAAAADDYSQWAHSCIITLNTSASGANVATPQTGFPVLIRLTSATPAFVFSQALAGGLDIRFANSSGTHLPYQIERFDQAGQLAEIWVKTDVNASDATQFITMYWGKAGVPDSSNGAAVFNNGFAGVWHMGDATTGVRMDATANGFKDSTYNYTANSSTSGIIGRADTLIGGAPWTPAASQYLKVPVDMGPFNGSLTYSVWAYPTNIVGQNRLIDFNTDTAICHAPTWTCRARDNIVLSNNAGAIYAQVFRDSSDQGKVAAPAGSFEANVWQHITLTISGATGTIYKNGAQIATGTFTSAIYPNT